MIDIRPIRAAAEFHAVEQLQREVWNVVDLEIVPALHLIPATAVGAILLGAFDGERLAGFVYGFPGFEGNERIIHSDMLAVLPDYRGQGLGQRLKMAQREAALRAGIHRITWTFDPLQARNAHINFHCLGVTSRRYLRDFYGETTSPLHRGIGTDRLWVEWDLDRGSAFGAQGSEHPARIEIPRDIGALPADEALRWREKTRIQFEAAFEAGLMAVGFEQNAYILTPVAPRSA